MNENTLSREPYEEAIINMMSNKKMIEVSFYSFIIAKCEVLFDSKVETAGVSFKGINYRLVIGRKFNEWTLDERIAVLIHEARHILGGHVFRKGERDHSLFNMACDIAINQTIKNLPQGVLDPETGKMKGGALYPETFKFPINKNAEQYYELLKEEQKKQEEEKQECKDNNPEQNDNNNDNENEENEETGNGGSQVFDENGKPWKPANGNPDLTVQNNGTNDGIDDHSEWVCEGEGEQGLAESITKNMIEDAISRSRGNTPGDIENILKLWTNKPVISWKKVLRQYMASKTGNKTSTIKRRDRRFPNRKDLRGNKRSHDKHDIVVGVDTSGSMSDEEIFRGLVEIYEITKVNCDELKIIQIDTNIKSIEEFSQKTKTFNRRGYGGTYMGAIVPFMKEEKLNPDILIMISDMEIENVSVDKNWNTFKPKTIWLSTSGIIPDWNKSGHKVIDIKNV